MATNRSLQRDEDEEDGGGKCVEKQQDTSGVTYPPYAFKTVTPEEAAGKIGVTSLVMALALVGNCLVVTTVWRCASGYKTAIQVQRGDPGVTVWRCASGYKTAIQVQRGDPGMTVWRCASGYRTAIQVHERDDPGVTVWRCASGYKTAIQVQRGDPGVTVWRCRRLRTPTNVYIVSLAVSDLMVTLSCTWVHLVIPGSPCSTRITILYLGASGS